MALRDAYNAAHGAQEPVSSPTAEPERNLGGWMDRMKGYQSQEPIVSTGIVSPETDNLQPGVAVARPAAAPPSSPEAQPAELNIPNLPGPQYAALPAPKKGSRPERKKMAAQRWAKTFGEEQTKAWLDEGEIGLKERYWDTGFDDVGKKLPFSPIALISAMELKKTVDRLQADEYIKYADKLQKDQQATREVSAGIGDVYAPEIDPATMTVKTSDIPPVERQDPEELRNRDIKNMRNYLRELAEREVRGMTIPASIYEGATDLPAYMIEFLTTGGVISGIKGGAKRAAVKGVAKGVGKKALGWLGTGAARTALMPERVGAGYFERRLPKEMSLTPEGELLIEEAGDKPATAFAKAFGDILIENLSETAGEGMTAGIKKGAKYLPKKFVSGMEKAFKKMNPNKQVTELWTKAGYNGFIEEFGEERLGDLMRAATGVEDFGAKDANPAERTMAALASWTDGRQMLIEAGVLAVPMVGRTALQAGAGALERAVPETAPEAPETAPEVSAPPITPVEDDKIVPEAPVEGIKTTTDFPIDPETGVAGGRIKASEVLDEMERSKAAELEQAAQETDTEPTEGQKEAGNYKKGKIKVSGLDIRIENPKGSERSGTDKTGRKWSQKLENTYGYIKRTEGADGDAVDVFINDISPESDRVFVVNQVDPETGKLDEHKALIGFETAEEASEAYLDNYESGWKGLGSIDEMSMEEFKAWVESDAPKKSRPAMETVKEVITDERQTTGEQLRPRPEGDGKQAQRYDEQQVPERGPAGVEEKGKLKRELRGQEHSKSRPDRGSRPTDSQIEKPQEIAKTEPGVADPTPGEVGSVEDIERRLTDAHNQKNPKDQREIGTFGKWSEQFSEAFEKKDASWFRKHLGHGRGFNDSSKKVFFDIIGKRVPSSIAKIEQLIDEWAGITPKQAAERRTEERKRAEQRKKDRVEEQKEKARRETQKRVLSQKIRYKGRVMTQKEFIDDRIKAGYNIAKRVKGAKNPYRLEHPTEDTFIPLRGAAALEYAQEKTAISKPQKPVTPSAKPTVKPTAFPDAARIQELKNSIAEGEMLIKSGKDTAGNKMPEAKLNAIKKSVENTKAKLAEEEAKGQAEPEKPISKPKKKKPAPPVKDKAGPSKKKEPTQKPSLGAAAKTKKISVAEALNAGEKIKAPKGTTFLQVTDMDGNKSVVAVKDADTLKEAGPFRKVEFGNKLDVKGRESAKGKFVVQKKAKATSLPGFPSDVPISTQPDVPVDPIVDQDVPPQAEIRFPLDVEPTMKQRGEPVNADELIKSLEKVVKAAGSIVPIRIGHFKNKARGIFKVEPEVMRLREANNIPTAAHEMGHALEKAIYGWIKGGPHKARSGVVQAELTILGRKLYGDTKPAGGYKREGFAEFMRLYLTSNMARKEAPSTYKWFEEQFLKENKEVAESLKATKEKILAFQKQGAERRVESAIAKNTEPGVFSRVRSGLSKKNWIEEAAGLEKLVKTAESLKEKKLPIEEDPFLTFSAFRHTHTARTRYMVENGMIDVAGNMVGPPLEEIGSIVRKKRKEFTLYLLGRRAMERWRKGKNPGITEADAKYIVDKYDSPKFQIAAQKVYDWNRGVLNYALQSGLINKDVYAKIIEESEDYVPLSRVFDKTDVESMNRIRNAGGNPLKTMTGSGRRIRDIFPAMIENAEKIIRKSHERVVIDQILRLRHIEGMGHMIEQIPRDMVPQSLTLDQIKQQLQKEGVDLSEADLEATITMFVPAQTPKGKDFIVPLMEDGKLKWFELDPELYQELQGLDIYRLPKVLDLFLGMPARAFRMGTTGLRAAFSLFTNPIRDVQTFMLQTHSNKNPVSLLSSWLGTLFKIATPGIKTKELDAFRRLGGEMAMPLGVDTRQTKRAAKNLFRNRVMKVVTSPVDIIRDVLQIPEGATRATELKVRAKEAGWDMKSPITLGQSLQMLLDSKRVTTDFSAAGKIAKAINQAVPFFNPGLQGPRTFVRTLAKHPLRSVFWGLVNITLPTLLLWWRNKDEEWYKDMPYWERYTYYNVDDGENIWRIPKPFEWANFFSVIPEAIFNAWYEQDPKAVEEGMKHIVDNTNPLDYPVLLKIAKEQWENKIEFTDRPIVPQGEILANLPPGEQAGPYTSKLAKWVGKTFPGKASPRRIDHAIRGYFGGLGPDLLDTVGLGRPKREGPRTFADLPVIGRAARRGGRGAPQSIAVDEFFDKLKEVRGEKAVMKRHSEEEDLAHRQYRLIMNDAYKSILMLRDLQYATTSQRKREEIQGYIREVVTDAMDSKENMSSGARTYLKKETARKIKESSTE